jgi:hypothetical protein
MHPLHRLGVVRLFAVVALNTVADWAEVRWAPPAPVRERRSDYARVSSRFAFSAAAAHTLANASDEVRTRS